MKASIKAWQSVFNERGIITDGNDLKALDCILYGPVWEIEELTMDIADKMRDEFVKLHPDFRYDHLEIRTIQ